MGPTSRTVKAESDPLGEEKYVRDQPKAPDHNLASRGMTDPDAAKHWNMHVPKHAGEQHHMEQANVEHHSPSKNQPKLGSGGRFKAIEEHAEKSGYSKESAGAIAASIGRKKYGAKKMAKLSAGGKK